MKNMHIPDPGMTFLLRMDMTLQCWTKAIPVQQPQNSIFRTQSARILASNLPIHGNKSEPRVKHRTLQAISTRWQSEWFFFYIPLSSSMKDEVILSLSLIKPFNCWDLWLSLSLRILVLLQSSRIQLSQQGKLRNSNPLFLSAKQNLLGRNRYATAFIIACPDCFQRGPTRSSRRIVREIRLPFPKGCPNGRWFLKYKIKTERKISSFANWASYLIARSRFRKWLATCMELHVPTAKTCNRANNLTSKLFAEISHHPSLTSLK